MAKHSIKRNDVKRVVADQVLLDGVPLNLSGSTVKFIMRNKDTGAVLSKDAVITDAANGKVQYEFAMGETATAGEYQVEWELSMMAGKMLTVPDNTWHDLVIVEDLG
jgi:hypothetical protein